VVMEKKKRENDLSGGIVKVKATTPCPPSDF
jgi:hypothetical protein